MISPSQIIRAKNKAAIIIEDKLDAPIIDVMVSIEGILQKEKVILEKINVKKLLQETKVEKVSEISSGIVDEESFMRASKMIEDNSFFQKKRLNELIKNPMKAAILVACIILIYLFIPLWAILVLGCGIELVRFLKLTDCSLCFR